MRSLEFPDWPGFWRNENGDGCVVVRLRHPVCGVAWVVDSGQWCSAMYADLSKALAEAKILAGGWTREWIGT